MFAADNSSYISFLSRRVNPKKNILKRNSLIWLGILTINTNQMKRCESAQEGYIYIYILEFQWHQRRHFILVLKLVGLSPLMNFFNISPTNVFVWHFFSDVLQMDRMSHLIIFIVLIISCVTDRRKFGYLLF